MEQKRNFSKELERIIKEMQQQNTFGKSLLLHSCCAPCSSSVMEYLRQYFRITVFYYNPNISMEAEYQKRVAEQKRLIDAYNKQLEKGFLIDCMEGDYKQSVFYEGGKFGTILEYKDASGEIKELFNAFNDMSSRLHIYEEQNIEELTLERNKFESVLMSIANGVVVCDSEDSVVLVNPIAEHILSIKQEQIIDTSFANYLDTEGAPCFKEEIETFKKTPLEIIEKKPLEFSVNVNNRVVKSVISPMFSKSHDYLGYIIVLIDITREAEVDRLKSDFISNVSHELRTPVTVLRSYIDTLYNYGNEFKFEEQQEFIGVINQEIIRLNNMVNDILDFSKLESNARYEKTNGDLMLTLENTLSNLKILAEEKNVNFIVEKEGEIPEIPYNEESIERVVTNLISNAVKYAPNDTSINIKAKVSDSMPGFIEVTVSDKGIGISKEHQAKIFDRFYRVENDTHTIKGTGLGLHLVKVTIEKHHGGKVFVESELNKGSTFGFYLPINPVEENVEELKAQKAEA